MLGTVRGIKEWGRQTETNEHAPESGSEEGYEGPRRRWEEAAADRWRGSRTRASAREGGLSRLWGDDCFCPSLAFSPFSLLEVAYQLGGVSPRVSKPTDY